MFAHYQALGLDLLDSHDPCLAPVRYSAVWHHADPERAMARLAQRGVRAIAPIGGVRAGRLPPRLGGGGGG